MNVIIYTIQVAVGRDKQDSSDIYDYEWITLYKPVLLNHQLSITPDDVADFKFKFLMLSGKHIALVSVQGWVVAAAADLIAIA